MGSKCYNILEFQENMYDFLWLARGDVKGTPKRGEKNTDPQKVFGRVGDLSHEKKTLTFHESSWLVNRDPYKGLWNNPHITG